MAGSPKKRARREAAEREKVLEEARKEVAAASGATGTDTSAAQGGARLLASAPPISGDILPAEAPEPTRTALKRAMRARAQEHAEKAIAVLVGCLQSEKEETRRSAANDLLAWGFGKPATEIEAGEGAQMIVIRRFGEDPA